MNSLLDSWSPSVVFTPSTSHKRHLQAKDWSYIDTWLSRHYFPNPVPPFERNPETLKYFLQLAALNEQEDERKRLEKAVKEKALGEMRMEVEEIQSGPLMAIEGALGVETKRDLETLALLNVAVGCTSGKSTDTAEALYNLNKAEFQLEQQAFQLDLFGQKVRRAQEEYQTTLERLRNDPLYNETPDMRTRTREWENTMKYLQSKAEEYVEKAEALERDWEKSGSSRVLIPDLVAEEKSILELKEQVLELESRAKSYQGLPPEKDLARLELERATAEMEELVQKREELYERMAR